LDGRDLAYSNLAQESLGEVVQGPSGHKPITARIAWTDASDRDSLEPFIGEQRLEHGVEAAFELRRMGKVGTHRLWTAERSKPPLLTLWSEHPHLDSLQLRVAAAKIRDHLEKALLVRAGRVDLHVDLGCPLLDRFG